MENIQKNIQNESKPNRIGVINASNWKVVEEDGGVEL
jgi:hypothetical protein